MMMAGALLTVVGCATERDEGVCDLENFLACARETADERTELRPIVPWERTSKYEIIGMDGERMSYRATEYQFTGGAHGHTAVRVGTINRRTGCRYRLADVIPEDRRAEVLRQVREDIARRHYGVGSYAEWRAKPEIRFFDEPQLVENFYLDGKNIHFVYNQYEIACYADGIIEAIAPLP